MKCNWDYKHIAVEGEDDYMSQSRIKYYSARDMSTGWHLQAIGSFFVNWEERVRDPDINTVLELFNIKKFLDSGSRLVYWSDQQVEEYNNKGKEIPRILGQFCGTLSDANLAEVCGKVERIYSDDFWTLLCENKVYKGLSPEAMGRVLDSNENNVWHVLRHRELSVRFGQIIAEHLGKNPHTAEKLISNYLAAHDNHDNYFFFPNEFTQEMREKALNDFVESDSDNINCFELLERSQSTDGLYLPDRLRYKARKKREILQERLFAGSPGMEYGAEVAFRSIPDGSVEESFHNGIATCVYSREWVEENQDYPTLLNNFIYLFGFVDRQFRSSFVSLQSQMGTLESHIGVKGKKDYIAGIAFQSKRILSLLQMAAYNQELQRLDICLEDIFRWFFEEYLRDEFGANGFSYSPPSKGTTAVEKCKLLVSAIDGALKQYRLYCEDGYVNRELLEMSSGHIVFDSLMGCIENKYAYALSENLRTEMFLLFSDQSMMSYTKKTESNYQTVPQLLLSERIRRDDYEEYQLHDLDWLMERGAIAVSDEGFLKINLKRILILKDLFYNEVICPNYYGSSLRKQVDELIEAGDICYGSTLFSKPEQNYLNYILNKKEYSNGLDLRNKYAHDTCPLDEKTQQYDYLELQKIMVLIILKINEELCLKDLQRKRKAKEQ